MTQQEQTNAVAQTIESIINTPNFKGSKFNRLVSKTCAKFGTNESYIRKVAGWTKRAR